MKATVEIFINRTSHEVQPGLVKGEHLHQLAGLSGGQQLFVERKDAIDIPVAIEDYLAIDGGEKFSVGDGDPPIVDDPCLREPIMFFFNGKKFDEDNALDHAKHTGAELKALDPDSQPGDGLFAELDGFADEPIREDMRIIVQHKDHFITTPCGNVGDEATAIIMTFDEQIERIRLPFPQATVYPNGHNYYLVIPQFPLPEHWSLADCDLMLQIPHNFPLGCLDMFWVSPRITLHAGRMPEGATNLEAHLGREWQRFSWHYQGQNWEPQRNTLESHLRFCKTRLEEDR